MAQPIEFVTPARVWSKVDCRGLLDCWLWTGSLDRYGYGQYEIIRNRRRHSWRAHRLTYELSMGPIPDGLHLDHLCRVRHCVNPAHLEPVTREENRRRGLKPGLSAHALGEVIRRYEAGESLLVLGRSFGVSPRTVASRLRVAGVDVRPRGRPSRR